MTPIEAFLVKYVGTVADRGPVRVATGRKALVWLFRDSGFTRGAEIGVWRGAFAKKICVGIPGVHLIAVDPWAPYETYHECKNDQASMRDAKRDALACLADYDVAVMVATSFSAAADVPDRSLDFVYLDANHEAAFVQADLALWIPKIRAGGIIAGHDYGDDPDKPFIQVKAAVDDYTARHGITPWFELTGDKVHSFFWEVR